MEIQLARLRDIEPAEIISLMNEPRLRRHMPLLGPRFDAEDCVQFIAAKERMWREHGFGPCAFLVDGRFAGWGGIQPEDGEGDLALVLHPRFWGAGRAIYGLIIERAFAEMGLEEVTVLLPPSRNRVRGILRLGFQPDGEQKIEGEQFIRFRLTVAEYKNRFMIPAKEPGERVMTQGGEEDP